MTWLAVAVGGALGSLARHAVNSYFVHQLRRPIPYPTLTVNLVGCFVIGALAGSIAGERLHLTPAMRSFIFVGVLGGFTTFSSFGLDTFTMGHSGQYEAAFWNVTAHAVVGVGAVWAGYYLALVR
jgi:CrcB protein